MTLARSTSTIPSEPIPEGRRDDTSPLACPNCRSALSFDGGQLRCSRCAVSFESSRGVPSFLAESIYWQIAAREVVEAFIEAATRDGWTAAVAGLPADLQTYWFSNRRADFRTILPSRQFKRALDLGCGTGAITVSLASEAEEIWGLDTCLQSLVVLSARAQHLKLDNVRLAHGTATALPFADGKFDLIVMNGVLERVGYAGAFHQVAASQKQALAEAFRCLAPGGVLYIGIENRFGANYLLGAPDEHTGLRYANVLPRQMANAYCRRVKKRDFTAFTHSYGSLRRMLKTAGFDEPSFWSPIPTYREIRVLEPLTEAPVNLIRSVSRLFPHRVPAAMAAVGRLVPPGLWKHVSPHFSVVAVRSAGSR